MTANDVIRSCSLPQESEAGIALGLGLTNECNLACAFCYRDPTRMDRLSLAHVRSVLERLPVRTGGRVPEAEKR
jgi:MoaA/NifB/PqqE/SkfB family radical SAM enzyme